MQKRQFFVFNERICIFIFKKKKLICQHVYIKLSSEIYSLTKKLHQQILYSYSKTFQNYYNQLIIGLRIVADRECPSDMRYLWKEKTSRSLYEVGLI